MQATVEFYGPAFTAAGRRRVTLELPERCTAREVVAALAQAVPSLVGRVISEDRRELIPPNLFDVGATRVVADLDEVLDLAVCSSFAITQEPC